MDIDKYEYLYMKNVRKQIMLAVKETLLLLLLKKKNQIKLYFFFQHFSKHNYNLDKTTYI